MQPSIDASRPGCPAVMSKVDTARQWKGKVDVISFSKVWKCPYSEASIRKVCDQKY